MKTIKEIILEDLSESTLKLKNASDIVSRNKGRKGKTVINAKGEEVEDSVVLSSNGAYVLFDASSPNKEINSIDVIENKATIMMITSEAAKTLKKYL